MSSQLVKCIRVVHSHNATRHPYFQTIIFFPALYSTRIICLCILSEAGGFKIAEMRLWVEAFTSIPSRPLLRASLSIPSLFHPFHAGLPSALPSGELHRRFHPSTGRVPDRATWGRVARARLLHDGHCASILCRCRSRMAGA